MSALKALAAKLRPSARANCGLVAVHFSNRKLHLLQLERRPSLQLRSTVSLPLVTRRQELLASPKATRTLLRRAMKQGNFKGKRVISTLPLDQVRLMSISHPAVSPDAEPASIASLMADRVEGDLSNYVIDYVPVRTSIRDGERLCIVAVSRREQVIAYLDTLSNAGLAVEALEVAPLSVRRLLESMSTTSNIENVLAINMGQDVTYLTLISGRRLLANQEVAFGGNQLVATIAKTLDVSPDVARSLLDDNGLRTVEESHTPENNSDLGIGKTLLEIVRPEFMKLVREIERAFLYAASESYGSGVNRICLFGGLTHWEGADELLGSLVQMPVEKLGAARLPFKFDRTDGTRSADKAATELAVPAGLALWRMNGDD